MGVGHQHEAGEQETGDRSPPPGGQRGAPHRDEAVAEHLGSPVAVRVGASSSRVPARGYLSRSRGLAATVCRVAATPTPPRAVSAARVRRWSTADAGRLVAAVLPYAVGVLLPALTTRPTD